MNNICVCCGTTIPEGTQVCPKCLEESSKEKPIFIKQMIDDLKVERFNIRNRLCRIEYTIKELEIAERRLK